MKRQGQAVAQNSGGIPAPAPTIQSEQAQKQQQQQAQQQNITGAYLPLQIKTPTAGTPSQVSPLLVPDPVTRATFGIQ